MGARNIPLTRVMKGSMEYNNTVCENVIINAQEIRALALSNSVEANKFIIDSIKRFEIPGADVEGDFLGFQRMLSLLHDALIHVIQNGMKTEEDLQRHPPLLRAVAACEKDLVDLRQKIAALIPSERQAKRVRSWAKFKWIFMDGNPQIYEERFKFHADMINFHCGKIIVQSSSKIAELTTERKPNVIPEQDASLPTANRRCRRSVACSDLGNETEATTKTTETPIAIHRLSVSVGIDSGLGDETLDSIGSRLETAPDTAVHAAEAEPQGKIQKETGSICDVEREVMTIPNKTDILRDFAPQPEAKAQPTSKHIFEYFNCSVERRLSGRRFKALSSMIAGAERAQRRSRRILPKIIRRIGIQ